MHSPLQFEVNQMFVRFIVFVSYLNFSITSTKVILLHIVTNKSKGKACIHSFAKKREKIEVVLFAFSKTLRRVNDIIGEIPNLHIRDNDNYNAWLVTAGES